MNVQLKEFIEYLGEIGNCQSVFNSPVTIEFHNESLTYNFRIWRDGLLILGLSGHKNDGWEKYIINRTMAQMFAGFVQFVEDTQNKREGK